MFFRIGPWCVNSPNGTDVMQQIRGRDSAIAVMCKTSIHSLTISLLQELILF